MADLSQYTLDELVEEIERRATSRDPEGCGDSGCVVRKPSGMATNGGCRCAAFPLRRALVRARAALTKARAEAFDECAAEAQAVAEEFEERANLPHAKGTPLWQQRMDSARGAFDAACRIRARKDGAE